MKLWADCKNQVHSKSFILFLLFLRYRCDADSDGDGNGNSDKCRGKIAVIMAHETGDDRDHDINVIILVRLQ